MRLFRTIAAISLPLAGSIVGPSTQISHGIGNVHKLTDSCDRFFVYGGGPLEAWCVARDGSTKYSVLGLDQ
jgi:hypothetical protein